MPFSIEGPVVGRRAAFPDGTLRYRLAGNGHRGRRFPAAPMIEHRRREMQSLWGLLHRGVPVATAPPEPLR